MPPSAQTARDQGTLPASAAHASHKAAAGGGGEFIGIALPTPCRMYELRLSVQGPGARPCAGNGGG